MSASSQVVNLLLDALVIKITEDLVTDIDPADVARADIVKKGLLQTNKISNNIEIGVSGGDHEDPNYMDGIVSLDSLHDIAMYVPAREIGGGEAWWRRGVARVECFFIREGLAEDDAHEAAYTVLGRLIDSIQTLDTSGITDDFGEHAIKMFCYGNTFFESGGPPKAFIFRGKVFWACLTERH